MAENNTLQDQMNDCAIKYNEIFDKMLKYNDWWYPEDYYNLEAVDRFIAIIRNNRADNVKDMVNLYKTDNYQETVIYNQDIMTKKMDIAIQQREEMRRAIANIHSNTEVKVYVKNK